MKLPYFNLYPTDFLVGTASMNCTEKGAYISLLCYQWDKGFVPESIKEIASIAGCSQLVCTRVISKKFKKIGNGFKNQRLERERQLAIKSYRQKCDSGRKGAESRWHRHPSAIGTRNAPAMRHQCQSESESESERKGGPFLREAHQRPPLSEMIRREKELKRVEARCEKLYSFKSSWTDEDRAEFKTQKDRRTELLRILGMSA